MLNNNLQTSNPTPLDSHEPLIFELSRPGKIGANLPEEDVPHYELQEMLPAHLIRDDLPLPEVSELDVVRHFTRLSQRNYGIDVGFYPLGSCTMKYNPKVHEKIASMPGFALLHPLQPEKTVQGALSIIWRLQNFLTEISGMDATTLQPAAGAHGELLAMMMTRAYHLERGDYQRNEIVIPDSAHGTNPASAARCGFTVRSIPSGNDGCVALEELKKVLSERTAALMLTNPNTLGLFETEVVEICALVHEVGGLVYCDGANMNALLGIARPGDMGFDIMHFNLHKTFSTPHGGGGPGGGAVSVKKHLEPFLPVPVVERQTEGEREIYRLNYERPRSIGRIHSFYGAFLVALRAYAYILTLGPKGLREVAENAILNANYVRALLKEHYDVAYNSPVCMHEVVLSAKRQKQESGVRALDISKRLMDYGFHPPTNYFPLIVPEALMIEPTETESKQTLDRFIAAMIQIAEEAKENPELVKSAPHGTPVSRLDEVKAVKHLDVRYEPLFAKKGT
ncbi:aminomethyl-transferring glycine dehydrogenase subunit GcvPB [Chthonomonas calidirosea]|uniref:aminomethyl-transferring glycine dehydrogenase subunit GcvPB n=1 Tax=Chthonomonas calidirosea TaxID=454171 RepID=UPI0006ECCE55|nr:aminomethyl-transferring glycine dehydrogenase subunit GcvPB [Chthonomonas calidirosea]CEK14116.1 glycine dehydrogenase (decarboxylating) beta subunit [Chthonomonas calidirosea]